MHPNWRGLASADIKWKTFIRSSCNVSSDVTSPNTCATTRNADGEQVANFYRQVVGSDSSSDGKKNDEPESSSKKRTVPVRGRSNAFRNSSSDKQIARHTNKTFNDLLVALEKDDVGGVLECLGRGADVNGTDMYGWTPLMCAACSGAAAATLLLLQRGADTNATDKSGKSAVDIAARRGHAQVVQIIHRFRRGFQTQNRPPNVMHENDASSPQFHCSQCDQTFKEDTPRQHNCSIVHLFNSGVHKRFPTAYGIPDSNRGFQMLIRNGWDRENGLGPSGCGQKFPMKTVLKRDRRGLGNGRDKARITHFDSFDKRAIGDLHRKQSERRVERHCRQMREEHAKWKEMKWRRELNSYE